MVAGVRSPSGKPGNRPDPHTHVNNVWLSSTTVVTDEEKEDVDEEDSTEVRLLEAEGGGAVVASVVVAVVVAMVVAMVVPVV